MDTLGLKVYALKGTKSEFSYRLHIALKAKYPHQSVTQISELIGINCVSLSNWLCGKNYPHRQSMLKLSQILNLSENWLKG